MTYFDVLQPPFAISGFPWLGVNGNWNRIPESYMASLPAPLAWVAPQPSGGMIRFRTDSRNIALRVRLTRAEKSGTVTPAALSGFCLYEGAGPGKRFAASLVPAEPLLEYEIQKDLGAAGERDWTLYTPLQNPLDRVEVGLDAGASLAAPAPFRVARPVLFYGSSITCGFCASRPGLTYPARICRAIDAPLVNLGFGGNAKGETQIAQAIVALELACFVLDYDHNAPNPEHLQETHQTFFQIIRAARPELPVVMVSAPSYHSAPEYYERRRRTIEATWQAAKSKGDRRVWFVDGRGFFPADSWGDYTVDCLHPNDMGFQRMAQLILPAVAEAVG